MKKKNNRYFYIERAIQDLKTLVIYFNVTRPQYEKAYKDDSGKFSKDLLLKSIEFLSSWNGRSKDEKKRLAFKYVKCSTAFNYTFGIPCELIQKVLGVYRDENNKKCRISIDDVAPSLIQSGFMRVINDGRKIDYKTKKVKCWWTKKYLLKNEKYWFMLLDDKRYSSISTFPYASERVKGIVCEWIKGIKDKSNMKPIGKEELFTMYKSGGINAIDFMELSSALFGMDLTKWYEMKKDEGSVDNEDTTTDAQKKDFWNRIANGNLPMIKDESFRTMVSEMTSKYKN